MENRIDITGIDLKEFVKEVYALSKPQGMGILHYQEGELSDTDAQEIIEKFKNSERIAISMDYVRGRACKMTVWKENGKLLIVDNWYDHSDLQFEALLKKFGKPFPNSEAA